MLFNNFNIYEPFTLDQFQYYVAFKRMQHTLLVWLCICLFVVGTAVFVVLLQEQGLILATQMVALSFAVALVIGLLFVACDKPAVDQKAIANLNNTLTRMPNNLVKEVNTNAFILVINYIKTVEKQGRELSRVEAIALIHHIEENVKISKESEFLFKRVNEFYISGSPSSAPKNE